MPLFQPAPETAEEMETSRPLDISPEEVAELDEDEWYARAYRGDAVRSSRSARSLMGTVLGFFLAFTNVYVGPQDRLAPRRRAHGVHPLVHGLDASSQGGPREDADDHPREQLHAVDGVGRGLRDRQHARSRPSPRCSCSRRRDEPAGTQLPWYVVGAWVFFLRRARRVARHPDEAEHDQPRAAASSPRARRPRCSLQSLYSEGPRRSSRRARCSAPRVVGGARPAAQRSSNAVKTIDAGGQGRQRHALLPAQC